MVATAAAVVFDLDLGGLHRASGPAPPTQKQTFANLSIFPYEFTLPLPASSSLHSLFLKSTLAVH